MDMIDNTKNKTHPLRTLIVVDMQNDFITGPLGNEEARAIVSKGKKKIEEYLERGDEIIFTQDTHSEDYLDTMEGKHLPIVHCIKNTEGWKIADGLDVPEATHINKQQFGYMYIGLHTNLDNKEVEIIGLDTDICVISNALIIKAEFPDAEVFVDASCCAGSTPERHRDALEVMKSCQINVIGEQYD